MTTRIEIIRAKLMATERGYPVHAGCGGEVTFDGAGLCLDGPDHCHKCHARGSLEVHFPGDTGDWKQDVTALLSALDESTDHAAALESELVVVAEAVGHYEEHEGHYRRDSGDGLARAIERMSEAESARDEARSIVENCDQSLAAKSVVKALWSLLGCVERDEEEG